MKFFFFCLFFIFTFSTLTCSDIPSDFPLSKKEWRKCKIFIKKRAPQLFAKGKNFIPKQKRLPCPIEKDSTTGNIYIHLNKKKRGFIGQGCTKIVTRSILYGKKPEVIAHCAISRSSQSELYAYKNLKGVTDISEVISTIKRPHKKFDLFLKYYNGGTAKKIATDELKVSIQQLVTLFSDLSRGLIGMHERGFIHRDLKAQNMLLHYSQGILHALITDFGLARRVDSPDLSRISVPHTTYAPENLIMPVKKIDLIKAEAYSLATVFYLLLFKDKVPWGTMVCDATSKKQKCYRQVVAHYQKTKEKKLKKSHGLRKRVVELVFQILQPDPQKRLSLKEFLAQIQQIK